MLYTHWNSEANTKPTLSGRSLAHTKLSARQKAAIAAQIALREIDFDPTLSQAALMVGASVPYASQAFHLDPERRDYIAWGLDIPIATKTPLKSPKVVNLVQSVQPVAMSDDSVVELIRKIGLERIISLACEVEAAVEAVA